MGSLSGGEALEEEEATQQHSGLSGELVQLLVGDPLAPGAWTRLPDRTESRSGPQLSVTFLGVFPCKSAVGLILLAKH